MPGDRTPDNRRANAHFGRIDPFCLLPVGALVLAGAVFILNQAALEGVILLVIAAIIVVFDSWVNRPREFEQRTAAARRRPGSSTGSQSRAFTPPPRNQRPQDRSQTGGQSRTRMSGGGQNRGQTRGQGGQGRQQQPPAWQNQNQPRRQGQPGGQPGAMGGQGGRGGGPVRRGPGQPPNERPPFERSGNSAR